MKVFELVIHAYKQTHAEPELCLLCAESGLCM